MWIRGIIGVVFVVVGAVWVAQGAGAMHGSGMSGHSGYAVLGAVMIVIGLVLLIRANAVRRNRTGHTG